MSICTYRSRKQEGHWGQLQRAPVTRELPTRGGRSGRIHPRQRERDFSHRKQRRRKGSGRCQVIRGLVARIWRIYHLKSCFSLWYRGWGHLWDVRLNRDGGQEFEGPMGAAVENRRTTWPEPCRGKAEQHKDRGGENILNAETTLCSWPCQRSWAGGFHQLVLP